LINDGELFVLSGNKDRTDQLGSARIEAIFLLSGLKEDEYARDESAECRKHRPHIGGSVRESRMTGIGRP
jgi:hypothetical protein